MEIQNSFETQYKEIREEILFITGVISSLINRIAEDPDDIVQLETLKLFTKLFSFSQKEVDLELWGNMGRTFLSTSTKLYNSELIKWYIEPDPLWSESMVTDVDQVDLDSSSMVVFKDGKYLVRWTLPNEPSVYDQCQDAKKLIYTALVILEELLHITQFDGKELRLSILGKFDLTEYPDIPQFMLIRLQEADVTKVLANLIPRMIEENWQWYSSRSQEPRYEKHNPLEASEMYMFGFILAEITDQIPQFILDVFLRVPDYLYKDFSEVKKFFSDKHVLAHFLIYVMLLFDPSVTEDSEVARDIAKIRKVEIESEGIIKLFLRYSQYLRAEFGERWQENITSDKSDFGAQVFEILLNYFNKNRTDFEQFCGKRGSILRQITSTLRGTRLKSPEQMLSTFSAES